MADAAAPALSAGGHLASNVVHFARVLRTAGLPIGTGQALDALRALSAAGLRTRDDVYWTLFAVFVTRPEQRELFDQAFQAFWRDPSLDARFGGLTRQPTEDGERHDVGHRVAAALVPRPKGDAVNAPTASATERDAALTYAASRAFATKDFEAMTAEEERQARQAVRRLALPLAAAATRRLAPDPGGRRVDMRRTLRRSLRAGGAGIDLARQEQTPRQPPLVVLCDISGSMSRYARLLLHFLHALTNQRERTHTFLFGTSLNNVTRQLRHRDVDLALARVGRTATEWSGGTRIGASLATFNRHWARRVLSQGAVVLLITDGLDRDAGCGLETEIARLQRSCRLTIWLNPLLRFDGYAPLAAGARALVRHVDALYSVHNLESLKQLAHILSKPPGKRGPMRRWVDMSERQVV